ncbi:MAG: hypothetical protein A0129_15100 [Limnobacter sp. CACIAM 66H1]|uniref:hypothetical protein n=1 Tax=Limnobacter sp. CACIAM 66H1 TaxID=1813033 RepID=UPI0007A887A4|nr:hypothetical protein [Limnobacter sp. CACIAM 66H1]KYP10036.1 MAG: hypothetical protein A0129_15100 [Limnobacter sp. CACIAM 66H1]
MNTQARTFHEDHLKRKAQSLQLAYTRALNNHDGSAPLYLYQEMDFLGHFEPDNHVSLAMVPEVMQQDPVAGVMLMRDKDSCKVGCRVVSNQVGYPMERFKNGHNFRADLVIEV